MRSTTSKVFGSVALFLAMSLAAMSPAAAGDKTTNTILGAGIGAAARAVLSNGDTLTTLGGAAAGGLLGNILTEEPHKKNGLMRMGVHAITTLTTWITAAHRGTCTMFRTANTKASIRSIIVNTGIIDK